MVANALFPSVGEMVLFVYLETPGIETLGMKWLQAGFSNTPKLKNSSLGSATPNFKITFAFQLRSDF